MAVVNVVPTLLEPFDSLALIPSRFDIANTLCHRSLDRLKSRDALIIGASEHDAEPGTET